MCCPKAHQPLWYSFDMTAFFGGTPAYSQRHRNNLRKRDSTLTVLSVKKKKELTCSNFLKMIFLAWIFFFLAW